MLVDPQSEHARLFRSAAGPPPGPTDPYADLSNRVPVAGPALAGVLRILDAYAKAVPRKIFGSWLGIPSPLGPGGILGAGANREAIGAATDPNERFDAWASSTPIPFGGPIAETLTDPLLGLGPISKIGAPIRAIAGGAARGALGVTAPARGVHTIAGATGFTADEARGLRATEMEQLAKTMKLRGKNPKAHTTITGQLAEASARQFPTVEPFQMEVLDAKPGEDAMAQGFRRAGEIADKLFGGYPGRALDVVHQRATARGAPFALSERQKTSDVLSTYGNLFGELEKRAGMPLFEFYTDVARKSTPSELRTILVNRGVPDTLADVVKTDHKQILNAFRNAEISKVQALNFARDVAIAWGEKHGQLVDLPQITQVPGQKMAMKAANMETVRDVTRQMGINSLGDLHKMAIDAYGPDAPILDRLGKFVEATSKKSGADPLRATNDTDLILGHALYGREQLAKQADTFPTGMRGVRELAREGFQVEREQATTSLPYLVNNMVTRHLGMVAHGMTSQESFSSNLKGLQAALRQVRGKNKGLDPAEQTTSLLAPGAVSAAERFGITFPRELYPHRMIDIGDLAQSVDQLMDTSRMTSSKMGLMFPALYAVQGAIGRGDLAGALIGGIGGKAVQKLAPAIYRLEAIQDLFARSEMWYREVGRAANQSVVPFAQAVEDRLLAASNWKDIVARARNAPSPEQLRGLHESLLKTNGMMSADYVYQAIKAHVPGIKDSIAKELSHDWQNSLHSASMSGVEASRKAMLVPRMRNIDDKLKWALLFHTWALRSIPWYAENMAAHPAATTLLLRTMADSEKENQLKGLPDKFSGFTGVLFPQTALLGGLLHAFYGNGSLYWNPLMAANPFQGISDTRIQPDESATDPIRDVIDFGSAMGLQPNYIIRWLAHVSGLMGSQAPSPEFFRHGALLRDLPMGAGTDINAPARGLTDAIRRSFGQDPADLRDYSVRKRIREIAQEVGMDPRSPQVRLIETQPSHPIHQRAAEDIRQRGFAGATVSLASPLPGPFKFLGADEEAIRGGRAEAVRGMGLRPDVAGLLGPAVDAAAPETATYRGMSFPPPNAPGLSSLISGRFQGGQTDPQQIMADYMAWVQSQGIDPAQAWDSRTLQKYMATRRTNREMMDKMRAAQR